MSKKHYEVVAGVIEKNSRVFCCQRSNKGECAFKWEFPGGKIEENETQSEALIREIKEELSCDVNVTQYITTIEHEYNTFSLTMYVYLCQLINSEPVISEHINSMWCDDIALDSLDFAAADYKFLDDVKRIINNKEN